MYESTVEAALASAEPAVRWKVRSGVLGEPPDSPPMAALREEIRGSAVARLLALHNCVDWGGTSTRRANPWVTADALTVLRAAGRLSL